MSATSSLRAMLEVSLAHEYLGGPFASFVATPLPATGRLCRGLDLEMLQSDATLTLYTRASPSRRASVTAMRQTLAQNTFCWEIAPLAPNFAAITDVDFTGSTERIVLTSTDAKAVGGPLTQAALASAADVWPWQPLAFSYVATPALPIGTTLVVETNAGAAVAQVTTTNPCVIPIDLSAIGSGLYRLKRGKTVLASWFADERGAVGTSMAPASMLVLPGALLAAAFTQALGATGFTPPPVYTAEYPAREITWRYHIFNGQPVVSFHIEPCVGSAGLGAAGAWAGGANDDTGPFVPISAPEYPTAASFEAVSPYKLVQRPPQRFALLSGSTTRYAPLPVASPSFAGRGQSAGFCSDIFVYL